MKEFNPILKPVLFNSTLDPSHTGGLIPGDDEPTVEYQGQTYSYWMEADGTCWIETEDGVVDVTSLVNP